MIVEGGIMVIQPFEEYWRDYDEWYEKHRDLYLSELKAVETASHGIPRPWLEVGVGTGRFAAFRSCFQFHIGLYGLTLLPCYHHYVVRKAYKL